MKRQQAGIALVTAILVVSLATIAATAILTSANIAIHRTANLQDSEKAWWYADGVESWVKSVLERDLEDNKIDTRSDAWARPVDYLPVDEGFVRGAVVDLQGRFNLNNFATTDTERLKRYVAQFERLLQALEVEDSFQARAVASAVRDWVDADKDPTGFDGAEDPQYLGDDPPHRVPNRWMESVSELLSVKGVTKELYLKLRPHVAALPQTDTPVNVNTATPEVLRSLFKQSNPQLEKFIGEQLDQPIEQPPNYQDRLGLTANDALPEMLSVSSNYFMLRAEAVIGSGRVALVSSLHRPASGAPPIVLGHSLDID